jgi:hypothetical protein
MSARAPSFFARLFIVWGVFFRYLFSRDFAAGVQVVRAGALPSEAPAAPPPRLQEALPDSSLQLLGLLQRDGRFIDFLQEDVAAYSDTEIGAAARVVHEGCCKTLREHFTLEPVRPENEGSRVTLAKGFDASAVRLVGNVVGEAPFTGTLTHRGWRATEVRLPQVAVGHDVHVVAAAEVEL